MKKDSSENQDISISFIQDEVLSKSQSPKNVVFLIGGKSCFVCSEEILDYVNNFDSCDLYINIVSNDPTVANNLIHDMAEINYQNMDQITLEKHGYTMANSEIMVFENNDLIYRNLLMTSEFDSINSKMESL